ncbi:hypothetical protein I4F81_006063 [Pyropia yezoensis]|uniref:Uncharacterized protein n=1 Tax=Pyropia yezoensis TaxID=2788 RepID=A0ACC3C154_PYRYE|nr:hypothetical protein I4F81_006063 [Neopyropia yezoensis]
MDPQRSLLPGAAASLPVGGAAAAHASTAGGPPSEGTTGGGAGSSVGGGGGGGGSGKRGQVGDFVRRSDFERQVSTIREQVERVRANLAKAEQIRDAHDLAGGADAAAGGVPAPGEPGGVAP